MLEAWWVIYPVDDPYIEIKQAARSYGDIDSRALKYKQFPFVIDIDSVCPGSHRADFEVNLHDDEGTVYSDQVSLNHDWAALIPYLPTLWRMAMEAWTHGGSGTCGISPPIPAIHQPTAGTAGTRALGCITMT